MSWMDDLTAEQRDEMSQITAGVSHVRMRSSATKTFRHSGSEVVEVDRPDVVRTRSMFPYNSTAMCVDPSEVPEVSERLRNEGLFVEFDRSGKPKIESAKQQSDLAKAFGMKTGRDGYGHTDELGQFHNSGRRRAEECGAGRAKVRKAIETLQQMPESAPPSAVANVLNEYDIAPTDENTG